MSRTTRIEKALSFAPIKYLDKYEGNGELYYCASAFLYLTIEEHKMHDDRIKDRILEHVRSLIAGGNEPMFTAGPFWHYESVSMGLAVVRHTPSVYDCLDEVEREKIDVIMKCFAIATAFVSNDCNFYSTGATLTGNHSKRWNPNHRMGMVFPIIAAKVYFSAVGNARQIIDDILTSFDHDEYINTFEKFGFTRALYGWTTKSIVLEDGRKAPDAKELMMRGGEAFLSVEDSGSIHNKLKLGKPLGYGKGIREPFLYHGFDLDHHELIINDMYQFNYSGGKVISDTSNLPSGTDEDGKPLCYILDGTKSPVDGMYGMMYELVSHDAGGIRSSTSYCMHDFILVTETLAALTELGFYDPKDYPELFALIKVGNADVIYKGEHGYRSYSIGKGYDTNDTDKHNYLLWKDWWLENYA